MSQPIPSAIVQTRQPARMNYAAYTAFVESPENADQIFEMIYGVVYPMPSPSPLHNWIVSLFIRLFTRLYPTAWVFADNLDLLVRDDTVLKPDALLYTRQRLPRLPARLTVPPEIAVEIMSPSNTAAELHAKAELYLNFGVTVVLIVDPATRTLEALWPVAGGIGSVRLTGEARVDLSAVLPGLIFELAEVMVAPDDLA